MKNRVPSLSACAVRYVLQTTSSGSPPVPNRRRMTCAPAMAILWLVCLAGPVAGGAIVTSFAIPLRIDPNQAIWATGCEPIAVGSDRLIVDGGHFARGGKRVQIWGVNLCFGANFPRHEDAALVATRLAAAGVNSVRLHHMDSARWPRGIWNAKDGRTIEPQALDRLDYFINEMAERGIFINVNLHVGHKHSEVLDLPATDREFDKIYGIFTPVLVEAQKQYARDLLTHVNPYRKVRYADDPAVAFVEITNEDSFFMWDADETLRTLPPYYGGILRNQFNSWLRRRYKSDEALAAAWGKGTEPLGGNMLPNGGFASWDAGRSTPTHWSLEQHADCRAVLSHPQDLPRDAVQVSIAGTDDTQWHLQLTQGGFQVTQGRYYTLSFEAAGQTARRISCGLSQAHDPWGNLGLSRNVELDANRRTFRFGFVATASDTNARISFAFGGDPTQFSLAHVELRPGGQVGLAEGESPGAKNIELFRDNESTPRIRDRMMFLAETEKAYFDGMRSFIRNDLGCGALVTGTIVFGPLGQYAQSDMDFVDAHAYWQHPRFPGRPWDQDNWLIEQRPMTDHPEQATLFRLAAERLAAKPFTVSEYNHPAPLDAQAECVPMIASFGAAQDWDGIWLFTYSHATDDWARASMSGFFDIDANPAKWGFMPACAAVFREQAMAPLGTIKTVQIAKSPNGPATLAELHRKHGSNMLNALSAVGNIRYEDMLRTRIIPSTGDADTQTPDAKGPTAVTWIVDASGKGFYQVTDGRTRVCVGHASRFEEATGGEIRLSSPDFVALTVTPLDRGGKLLVTACGRCENVGMQFSADRQTVGRNWGKSPVQIEAVRGTVVLSEGKWTCHALAPDGTPKQQVLVAYVNGRAVLPMSPEYGTMWYLLERQAEH